MNESIYKSLRQQVTALLPDISLHRVVEQSVKNLHAKGLHCLTLLASPNVVYQVWLAWPGTTRHNTQGFCFYPTRALSETQVAVVAGSVALHLFADAPNAEFLDDELVALSGYEFYRVHEIDQVVPALQYTTMQDLAVVSKDTRVIDSGEGFHLSEGQMSTLSFDQQNFTLLLVKTIQGQHPVPLVQLTPEDEAPDYRGLYQKPTRDEAEHWLGMLQNYFTV